MENFTNKPLQHLEKMSDEELLKIYKTADIGDPQIIEAKKILDQRRDAKPLEEMSDEELSEICVFNPFQNYSYEKNQRREKAREILKKRKEEREAQRRKSLNNGSIKSLILNGDYRNVCSEVMLQDTRAKDPTWIYASINDDEFHTFTKGSQEYGWGWTSIDEYASNAITICRRKLNKEDIILCAFTNTFSSVMSGIIFTEEKIHSFYRGKPEYIIEYSEIDDVDFTENNVIIKVSGGQEVSLYCYDGRKYKSYRNYTQNMYNLIMDIKDRLEES